MSASPSVAACPVAGSLPAMAVAASVVPTAADVAPPAAGYAGVWYQITDGSGNGPEAHHRNKYGGAMATYPQQHAPIALRRVDAAAGIDRTFFVYGGFNGDRAVTPNMIGCFDHSTGRFQRPRTVLTRSKLDAHENPTLAIDDTGHLWMFSSGHGSDRRALISRSERPWAIDRWRRVADLAGGDALETFSYGQPHFVPGQGFVLLHTHYRGGGNRTLYTNRSADGVIWDFDWATDGSNPRPRVAAIEGGQYQISWRFGDTIATAFNMHPRDTGGRPGAPLDHRTNLYFLETRDAGRSWSTADGTDVTGSLPLTDPDNPALVADFRAAGRSVYLKDVTRDASDHPLLLFLTSGGPQPGPASGPHTLHTARFDQATQGWVLRDVLETDHNYDHGSLLVHPDPDAPGGERWRLFGSFLPGAQAFATGGNMGLWESDDLGETWSLVRRLTDDDQRNHSYFRRVDNAADGFIGLWSAGHAWDCGDVELFFCNAAGDVFAMPSEFAEGADTAAPVALPAPTPASAPPRAPER